MDAAHAAEVVPRGKGVELVEPQLVGTAHHVQSRQRHRGDHRALAPADRAIATARVDDTRSEEHTSELQSLMRISYAVFCLKKKYYTQTTMTTIASQYPQ